MAPVFLNNSIDPILANHYNPYQYFPQILFDPAGSLNIQQCTQVQIEFTGAYPAYRIFIIPAADANLSSLRNLSSLSTVPKQFDATGSFNWTVDPTIEVGTNVSVAIRDDVGTWTFSAEVKTVVANLNGTSCPPNNYTWYPPAPAVSTPAQHSKKAHLSFGLEALVILGGLAVMAVLSCCLLDARAKSKARKAARAAAEVNVGMNVASRRAPESFNHVHEGPPPGGQRNSLRV